MSRVLTLGALAVLLLVAGGGAADARGPNGPGKAGLKPFSDCRALVRYGKRHVKKEKRSVTPDLVSLPVGDSIGRQQSTSAPAAGAPDAGGSSGGGGSSGTNVQEAGVDELDVVKSKGSVIFAAAWSGLHAVDTAGGDPRLLDSVPQLGGWNRQLLLHGDRLLVIDGGATITEVDVSDPADLRVVRTQEIDGNLVGARLNGSSARIVISSYPDAVREPELRNRASGWRPSTVLRKARRKGGKRKPLLSCGKVRRARTFSGMDMLTVLTIDMDKGLPAVDSDAVLGNGELVYASRESLYVATQRSVDEPDSDDEDPPALSTLIHKFDTPAGGITSYATSGRVRGTLLSQWSMSEHEGALRVASTDTPPWWDGDTDEESESFVTVLEEGTSGLEQVGRVGGLGRGEEIYAVRFIGDLGYVVTFRQTDPLYTIDLGDPENPRVAGELKILGYSAYLHPVGENLLLGIGQDADEDGTPLGVQLSVFDVSDPAKPVRLYLRPLGGDSYSEVEHDHRAFLWWEPEQLAVLPLDVWGEDEDGSGDFMGAAGFRVGRETGIREVGRSQHPGGWDAYVTRSLVVDGRLFTLSDSGLAMNRMDTLARVRWVPFPERD